MKKADSTHHRSWMRTVIMLFVFATSFTWLHGQTTLTTTFTNNNGNSLVTFNFQNTNGFDVTITDVSSITGLTGANTAYLYYKTSAIAGLPGAISAANGWTLAASQTFTGVANTATTVSQPMLTGISLTIPAGATYGLAFQCTSLRYSTLAAGTYTQTGGGCNLIAGTNVSYGGSPSPAAPTFTPRGFIGSVTFTSGGGVPCAGTPAPGNTLSTSNPVCPTSSFTLTNQFSTPGTGVTYQWESSSDGVTYANIAGATNSSYTTTQTSSTYYRCNVTCSGSTGTSNPLNVTMNPFTSCYCASGATNAFDEEIYSVTVNGNSTPVAYSGAAGCTTVAPGPGSILGRYSNFTTLGTFSTLGQGETISFTIAENECDGATYYSFGTAIWIDYNQNGSFLDAGEKVFVEAATAVGPRNVIGTFTIPLTAMTGTTGMRITVAEGYAGASLTPCLSYGYGETEDFIVNISAATACTGTPAPGNTLSTANPVCGTTSFTLSNEFPTTGTGVSFQWQSSLDGVSYTNIAGATASTYTTTQSVSTYYRCNVTCATGGTGTSNPLNVAMNPFTSCYCTSMPSQAFDEEIYSVTVGAATTPVAYSGAAGCTTAAPGPGSILGRYSNFTTLGSFTSLAQGDLVSFTIAENECDGATYYSFGTSIWIDYNQNGSFSDAGEQVFVEPSTLVGPRNISGTFIVPMTATAGVTGMRITVAEGYAGASLTPCLSYGYGETEDFLVTIIPGVPCTGTPVAGTVPSTVTVCSGTATTISTTGYTTGALGITFQWQESPDGIAGWTNVTGGTGATSPSYTTPALVADNYYRCVVSCSYTGLSSNSNVCTADVTTSPLGDVFANPIIIGSLPYTAAGNNQTANCWHNDFIGQGSPDVYYKVIPDCNGTLNLNLCGGGTMADTYLHLLNAAGTVLVSNDDNGPSCTGLLSSINYTVSAGVTYYIVVEGYNLNEGTYTLSVSNSALYSTWFADVDGDVYGDPAVSTTTCDGIAPFGFVGNNLDCNDADAAVNPAATEICNGIDDNCDGLMDDADPLVTGLNLFFIDSDLDGFGDPSIITFACVAPFGYAADPSDCNDADASINPGATEICNGGIDDNCDGLADDDDPAVAGAPTWYPDVDGDTWGDGTAGVASCIAPPGYIADGSDCDDTHILYTDADGDGYGIPTPAPCGSTNVSDCNDASSISYPGATEVCDGLDNDCDGTIDEETVTATVTPAVSAVTCRGDLFTFVANEGPGYMYQWFKNGNLIPGATDMTYASDKAGYYQVQVTIPAGCFATSAATLLNVNPNPNANISAPNGTSLCTTVKLKASYDATYTWQWYQDGSPVPGATTYLYYPTVAGSYYCALTNAYGCGRNTASMTVTACREAENELSSTIELYPNPTSGEVTVSMQLNTTETASVIDVVNMVGEVVYSTSTAINNGAINTNMNLHDVAAGVYMVRVVVGEQTYNQQLIIQK